MAGQRSVGTILFALLFLGLSFFVAQYPVALVSAYAHTGEKNIPEIMYPRLKGYVDEIGMDAIAGRENLKKTGKEAEFDRKFTAFKNEVESFRQKYIVQGNLLPHDQLTVLIGFLTCILNFIAGVGLLMHFRWARTVVFWALASTVLFFFALQHQIYWIVGFPERMGGTAIAFDDMLTGQCPGPAFFSPWRTFRMTFLAPPFLVGDLIALLYVLGVCYYFTRPKVKERFA